MVQLSVVAGVHAYDTPAHPPVTDAVSVVFCGMQIAELAAATLSVKLGGAPGVVNVKVDDHVPAGGIPVAWCSLILYL